MDVLPGGGGAGMVNEVDFQVAGIREATRQAGIEQVKGLGGDGRVRASRG